MNTNRLQTRSIEEFMTDYNPVYQPMYGLLLGKSQSYSDVIGTMEFRRAETIGDIRAREITPKDSEIRLIAVGESKKAFKKYFLANQFRQSNLQDRQGLEDVNAQVLDEHQKQFDELVMFGGGTASNNVKNNGIFWSGDSNFIQESDAAVSAGSDVLIDLYKKITTVKQKADMIAGRKLLLTYGDVSGMVDGLFVSNSNSFRSVLSQGLGSSWSVAQVPSLMTGITGSGVIALNLDQLKLHYTVLPTIRAQGTNEEFMYYWANFLMGSAMVEVLAKYALIKQPLTFA